MPAPLSATVIESSSIVIAISGAMPCSSHASSALSSNSLTSTRIQDSGPCPHCAARSFSDRKSSARLVQNAVRSIMAPKVVADLGSDAPFRPPCTCPPANGRSAAHVRLRSGGDPGIAGGSSPRSQAPIQLPQQSYHRPGDVRPSRVVVAQLARASTSRARRPSSATTVYAPGLQPCPCGCVRLSDAAKRYASQGRDRRASGGAHGPTRLPWAPPQTGRRLRHDQQDAPRGRA